MSLQNMRTNRQIIDALRESDPSAVEELIDRYSARMQHFLRRRRFSETEAADLSGDIFLSVVQAVRRSALEREEALPAFVWTIARRRATMYRTEPRQTPRAESLQAAKAILAGMPEQDRELLVRYYLGEQTPEQICESFGLTAQQWGMVKTQTKARFFYERMRIPVQCVAGHQAERCVA